MNDTSTDQEHLLMDILQSEIYMPSGCVFGTATIAEILFSPALVAHRDVARTKGVAHVWSKGAKSPLQKVSFAGRRLGCKNGVLNGTRWQNTGVLQILKRLPKFLKPVVERQIIAGTCTICVSVDYERLMKWTESKDRDFFNSAISEDRESPKQWAVELLNAEPKQWAIELLKNQNS